MWVLVIITVLGTTTLPTGQLDECRQRLRVLWPQMESIQRAYCVDPQGNIVSLIPDSNR